MSLQYTLVGNSEGESVLTVYVPGRKPEVADSTHPNFARIKEGVEAGDEGVLDLFDIASAAALKFERLGDRVTAANNRLYLDGEEVDNALATQVVRFLADGVEDWKPLVAFFENVQANPNEHSREQLYTWLNRGDFTITPEGLIVGYKGVRSQDGEFYSIHQGRAIVNGEIKTGNIPNPKDAIIEMPRGEVQFDPAIGCHTGLHVGTYEYASDFAQGALLEVHVNPRDVVSVPTDCDAQKMRVCRYTVIDTIDKPYTEPVASNWNFDDDLNENFWGDGEDDYCEDCGCELDGITCPICDETDDVNPDQTSLDDEDVTRGLPVEIPGGTQPVDGSDSEVQAGDKFEDLDKRRNRVLVVTQVDGDTVHYETEGGSTGGTVSLKRLLTPYRFRRI